MQEKEGKNVSYFMAKTLPTLKKLEYVMGNLCFGLFFTQLLWRHLRFLLFFDELFRCWVWSFLCIKWWLLMIEFNLTVENSEYEPIEKESKTVVVL